MEPFLLDASKQGTHLLRGQKIWSLKNVFIVSTGNRETFSGYRNPGLTSFKLKGTTYYSKSDRPKKSLISLSLSLVTMAKAFKI